MTIGRREALGGTMALAVAGGAGLQAPDGRKIRLGLVGCGQRGSWIAGLFARHGGYTIHAVGDYFADAAAKCGDAHSVASDRRFSGLDAYRKVIGCGVEAVALETPPYCFPLHAETAVVAGLHVYIAKPIAVDVPGCKRVEAAAARASRDGRVFLVDYQMPTDPGNRRVVESIRNGAIGKIAAVHSYYLAGAWSDPPKSDTIADRLQGLIWVNDTTIGSGYHGNACIHAVDAAMWAVGKVPIAAMGASRIGRPNPHGDSHDVISVTYEFEDGLVLSHRAKHLPDNYSTSDFCGCYIHGDAGYGWISYSAKAQLVSGDDAFREDVTNLYEAGASRNIGAFYDAILRGDASNPTVRRAIDSALVTVMSREAALRRTRLTMATVLRENRSQRVSLKGLLR
ncbi:MAG: Gfo/Idh/MocA family oxidoreductase [Armatimonadetes bacterium]|nr:Gfo/Idh/MocA family oxidoreductase [Armatimonadota bacterium]